MLTFLIIWTAACFLIVFVYILIDYKGGLFSAKSFFAKQKDKSIQENESIHESIELAV